MTYVLVLVQGVAAGLAVVLGIALLARLRIADRLIQGVPKTLWVRIPLAGASALAALVLLAGFAIPLLTVFGAGFAALAVAAPWLVATVRSGAWPAPAVLMASAIVAAALQPLGLKVAMLPKAHALPYAPAPATVVKTYGEDVGFEGVSAGADGTLYLAANSGLDFNVADYYRRARGQIIARRTDGSERVIFTTPLGSTAGVMAVGQDGTVFMTSNGRQPGVWRIPITGPAQKIAELPSGAWPNGLDFGPDGQLYSPDSALARVWRIDPQTGRFETVLHDKALAARPLVALAPGANGLHFAGRDMIVTVSDSAKVLRYTLGADGRFSAPTVIARGIPGDDFAIGPKGDLFITTHPYNTLVRVAPDGRRSVIGDARQHIVGATDAVFGRGPNDRDTLYVATDGGAFTKGAKARGQLVALKPFAR